MRVNIAMWTTRGNSICGPEDERPEFVFQRFLESIWQDKYETYLDCYRYFIDPAYATREGFSFFVMIFSQARNHWDGQFSVRTFDTPFGIFAKVYPRINEAPDDAPPYFTMRKIGHRWYMEEIIPGEYNPEPPPSERDDETKN